MDMAVCSACSIILFCFCSIAGLILLIIYFIILCSVYSLSRAIFDQINCLAG